jgi:uncharacterized Zn finger protein
MTNYNIDSREWWVERWLELLDSYRFKKRLERARIYAREGNVLSIEFKGSSVLAEVQGSETEPYQVSLSLDPFSDEDWLYVIETMSKKAIFSAQLLAGEMPANIEDVFIANGLSVFPFALSDVRSHCSCPDQANPCKHIGAVYYQLADRFSEDPFVLFQLRGRTKEQILNRLRQLRSKGVERSNKQQKRNRYKRLESAKNGKNKVNSQQFWSYNEGLESSLVVIASPTEGKKVLELLGPLPLPSPEATTIKQFLTQVYDQVSQKAIAVALNQEE